MFHKKIKIITTIILTIGIMVPTLSLAAPSVPGLPNQVPLKDLKFSDVIGIMNKLVSWFFTVFLIVAVVFIMIAAFYYLTSGGEPEKVKKATKQLVFAAVAIAVAMASVGIRFIVEELVTGSSNPACTSSNPTAPGCSGRGLFGP